MTRLLALILAIILICPLSGISQISSPVVFSPADTDSLLEAEFSFSPLPEYGRETILTVSLKAPGKQLAEHALLEPAVIRRNVKSRRDHQKYIRLIPKEALSLTLSVGPERFLEARDTILDWPLPIQPGDSMKISLPVRFFGVGEYTITLADSDSPQKPLQIVAKVVFDENGRLTYLGKAPAPNNNILGAHYYIFGDTIRDRINGRRQEDEKGGVTLSEPFTINLTIEPTLKVGQKSRAHLTFSPMTEQLDQLQYEIIAATNLFVDSLSPSPGDNPGMEGQKEINFDLIPQSAGRSFLSWQIFGYSPQTRYGTNINTTLRYYFVFGEDSSLLYMGGIDPFLVGFQAGNPNYISIDAILNQAQSGYGEKVYRSLPDFEYDRIDQQRVADSIAAGKLIDTTGINDKQ